MHKEVYTPHIPPQAIAYQRAGYALGFFGLFWGLFGLWLLLRSGLSVGFRERVYRWIGRPAPEGSGPPFRAIALYFLLFTLFVHLWRLPVGVAGIALEQHFGFAPEGIGRYGRYLADVGLSSLFSLAAIPLVWAGYWLLARFPHRWWLWLWGGLVPLIFAVIVLQPILIAPAYNHYTPLPPGPLRTQILALAAKAGIHGGSVFVEDTSARTRHVNAYVYGLGPTTRIVINDTALQQLPEDQILAMVGHEMGHYVEGHIWFGFAGAVVGAGIFLWLAARILPWAVRQGRKRWGLQGMGDLAALPLFYLILSLFMVIQSPIQAAMSRYMEHRADAFGLRITHLNDAMARLFVGFAERDYSDPDPPRLLQFWYGDHPTLKERIDFALRYKD